jgi:tRNA threonylcarbamoyladenosine biosynthesis protein TsaB
MRTLVIDTATRACSAALFNSHELIASSHEIIGRGHAEKLLPLIAALPEKGRADQIMVNIGPGSFTGIRVGVSAAKALAFVWRAQAHGYNCLSLVAAMAAAESISSLSCPIDVIMNAGHGEYFFQSFDADGLAREGPVALTPALAVQKSGATLIAGDAAAEFAALKGEAVVFDTLPNAKYWPLIAHLENQPPRPFYGRAPDAKPAVK